MGQGWFKLHRELFEKAIWQNSTPEQKVILITLLGMANHQGREWEWKGKQFKAEPGQFVTSIGSIVKKCGKGISQKNVRSAIEKFEKYGFLANESAKTGRRITIVNWEVYQAIDNEGGKDIGSEVADRWQTGGRQVATNKNDKNDKNVKNDKNNIYSLQSNEYRLAEYLFKHIKKNNSNAKEPNLQQWSKQFDYILRLDNRDLEEVKDVIKWCQHDPFWLSNILSPKKLRDKYETLVLQMKNKDKSKHEIVIKKENKATDYDGQREFDPTLEDKLLGWYE
jgi:hypothetical protein